jgi:AbrB family looped-hinge helix DNA binding protein
MGTQYQFLSLRLRSRDLRLKVGIDIFSEKDYSLSEIAKFRNYEDLTMSDKAKQEELVRLRARGQVTLPSFIREKLHLGEGNLVLIKVVDNTVVLVPQETIDKEQSWFWQDRWQKLEAEAEEDIRKGRMRSFDSAEELFDEIEGRPEAYKNGKVQKKRS